MFPWTSELELLPKVYGDAAPSLTIEVTNTSTGQSSSSSMSASIGDNIVVNGTATPALPPAGANYSCDQCISIINPFNGTQMGIPIGFGANGTTQWGPVQIPPNLSVTSFGIRLMHIPSGALSNIVTVSLPVTTQNDAYGLITQALAAGQTKIHLPGGNYSVSQEIDIQVPGVEIYGDGQNDTILRLNDNVYGGSNTNPQPAHVLNFDVGADGFHVHDLQIDGNAAGNPFQGNFSTPYAMNGVNSWNNSNGIIENCLIHDCRFMGVSIEIGSNCIVQNNTIINSGANGISVSNSVNNSQKGRGSAHQVLNNIIDGASDVGISVWEGVGTLVQGNTVQNIVMNMSPYQQNTCDGIIFEGTNPCSNLTFSNNTVSNISRPNGSLYKGLGIGGGPDGSSNIQFLNNTIQNVYSAIRFVGDVAGLVATGTSVNGTTSTTEPLVTIVANRKGNSPTGADLEHNTLAGMPSGMTCAIIVLLAGSGKFINNTIHANGNVAMKVNPSIAGDWVTTPNTIE